MIDETTSSSTADVGNSADTAPASKGIVSDTGRTIDPRESSGTPPRTPRADGSASPEADRDGTEPRDTAETRQPSRAESRIRELNSRVRDAQERYTRLSERLNELGTAIGKPPSESDFDNPAEYAHALVQHALKAQSGDMTREQAEAAQREVQEASDELWKERIDAMRARVPDFDEVVLTDKFQLHKSAFTAIRALDDGASVLYYLAKNPAEAARVTNLARQGPIGLLVELGRLSKSLEAPARVVSQAPAPIKTVTGGAAAPLRTPENMSVEEFSERYRERQKASRRH